MKFGFFVYCLETPSIDLEYSNLGDGVALDIYN